MTRFDDVVDRLKNAISHEESREETKAKHEENIFQEDMFRRRMQEELEIQEMKPQMQSKEYQRRDKIVKEDRSEIVIN